MFIYDMLIFAYQIDIHTHTNANEIFKLAPPDNVNNEIFCYSQTNCATLKKLTLWNFNGEKLQIQFMNMWVVRQF
jgi:hypothetical protein